MSRLNVESANGTRRVRWYTLVALALAPLLLAGVVMFALHGTGDRISHVTAAIVNEDAGAEINGQSVPLGRQLTAGLVTADKASGVAGNYDWIITDKSDAAGGLSDGRYAAVVTIPKNFSANATSIADPATATQARVDVKTSDDARIADGVITNTIADTAASVFGNGLSSNYLDNIYVGFNTLHDQLGTAATGAHTLATGAEASAAGAGQLSDGAAGLADGATQLSDGIAKLSGGARASADGAKQLSSGVEQYVDGTSALASGLDKLAAGTTDLPTQVSQLATGTAGVAAGVDSIAKLAASNPDMTLAELDAALVSQGSSLQQLAGGADQVSAGTKALSDGIPQITNGVAASASGADQLASNGAALTSGASQLSTGLGTLADGTASTSDGASKLADGAGTLATGVSQFADGSGQLADGTTSLADGLDKAVAQLPTYSASDRTNLASVVTDPVSAESTSATSLAVRSGMPLFISLALWIGAFAVYLIVQAVSRRALESRKSSFGLAFTSYLPGLAVGVVQGVAMAGLAQISLQLDVGHWFALAGIAALSGAVFAAVVQGLVALLGNAGRLVAAIAGAVALAAGLISTAPTALLDVAGFLPTSATSTAVNAIANGTGGMGGAVLSLLLWGMFGFALSVVAVVRRRTVRVRQLGALALG